MFDAVICAGTFTCGHVGPEALRRDGYESQKMSGYICFTVREQEWEAAPYEDSYSEPRSLSCHGSRWSAILQITILRKA